MSYNTVLTRDGCELAYRDTGGHDIPVVLLHGWSQSQAVFDRLIDQLRPGRRIISYDMRNHGRSGRTDNGARISALAADLDHLLRHLGIDHAHLLGHSMGASVLWSYLELFGPDRVRSLTLVDQPIACIAQPWLRQAEAEQVGVLFDFPGAGEFAASLLTDTAPSTRREFLADMLTDHIHPDDFEWLYQQNLLLPMPWGARLLIEHLMQDWRDLVPRITMPTLLIGATAGNTASGSQTWLASHIPDAELRIIAESDGGAHFAFYESPHHFATILGDFLGRVPT
ncbi:alpha/beta fold hydrolase [Nocardia sp. 004]|uniref:alpha/beta fold hydrolase n=1 Tax=Nocardia sp. 004 TaxID=3385978 RepID=UPI00399EF25C